MTQDPLLKTVCSDTPIPNLVQIVCIPSRIRIAGVTENLCCVTIVLLENIPFVRKGMDRVLREQVLRLVIYAREWFPDHSTER